MHVQTRNVLIAQVAEAEARPFRRTTPPHMHDELMQEAMIGCWKALDQLDGDRSPKQQRAWLGMAARSKVLSYLRYVQVRKREVPSDMMHVEGLRADGDLAGGSDPDGRKKDEARALTARGHASRPDDEVEAQQLARRIQRAVGQMLDSLAPEARLTVEARLGQGEAPVIPRRRRDEYVRVARDRLATCAQAEGLDLDLGAMLACQ